MAAGTARQVLPRHPTGRCNRLKSCDVSLARFLLNHAGEWESTMSIYSTLAYTDCQPVVQAANFQAPAAKADASATVVKADAPVKAATDDASATAAKDLETALFGADGFTFGDLVDVINPLQHIPIVSTIYRHFTGDKIATGPRVAGDGLFGGVVGLVSGLVNVAIEQGTGKDLGDHVMALLDGGGEAASTDFAALKAKPGAASGGDTPAPAPAPARAAYAARQYAAAAEPDPIYGRTLDIGP